MNANEVLEQVKALPPRERRKFFECIHEMETELDVQSSARRKPPLRPPNASTPHATVKTGKSIPSTPVALRRHPYDPYNPKVRARRMKLMESVNAGHNSKIADGEAALEKVIDEMYPETKHSD